MNDSWKEEIITHIQDFHNINNVERIFEQEGTTNCATPYKRSESEGCLA